jgi:hypothetical protein
VQLKTALRTQEFFGGHLGSILIDLGFLQEHALGETLSRAAGVRYAPAELFEDIPPEVIKALPGKVAERHRAVPIRIQQKRLHLAMLNPKDLVCLDEISYITGMVVVPYVAPEFRIFRALERYYGVQPPRAQRISISGQVDPRDLAPEPGSAAPPPPPARASSIPEGVGLDGLPLDAPMGVEDSPFAAQPPPTEALLDRLPRSLNEWREPERPAEARAAPPAALARDRTPISRVMPAPQPAPAPPPPPPAAPDADRLRETAQRLLAAEAREDIAEILLNTVGQFFRRRLLFFLQRDRIVGWDGWGDQIDRERVKNVLLPIESLSLFTAVKDGARPYRGPVADLPANRRLFEDLGLSIPPEIVLLPVVLKGRVVAVIYGDNGGAPLGSLDLAMLGRLSLQAAIALEILILRNKMLTV